MKAWDSFCLQICDSLIHKIQYLLQLVASFSSCFQSIFNLNSPKIDTLYAITGSLWTLNSTLNTLNVVHGKLYKFQYALLLLWIQIYLLFNL